ncbi:hypothetical protein EPK99_01795 [Neorhizobium lilium]|uniref:Uncharacterized protein n=1 Tax=Neorhizobium lilium TaxID=2503024 RepID=A0A3S3U3F6_9HYPH|nr:hypothetical protein [Neorhizobium lilium]RWX81089.1 hypothetical protein EPK99_01795 [Neorhizobium lilium]
MSNVDHTTSHTRHEDVGTPHPPKPPHKNRTRRRAAFGITAFAILALGAAAGAGAMKLASPSIELAPMTPVAISSMQDWSLVTVKGKVAEVFGNKFIVQDDSGRALVETGPSGESGTLVGLAEAVSVQGRFEHGFLHATYIVRQDGSIEVLGPAGGPPRHGPLEDMLRHGKP